MEDPSGWRAYSGSVADIEGRGAPSLPLFAASRSKTDHPVAQCHDCATNRVDLAAKMLDDRWTVTTDSTVPPSESAQFTVTDETAGLRLDQCLARCVPGLSRRTARIAIDLGGVFIDKKRVKVASRTVFVGQRVHVHLGTAFTNATKTTGREARARDEARLPKPVVLFEDQHLIAVIKPAGLLSAPTPESDRNNLVSVLAHRTSPPERLFVVHRLDLHTSGVLVVARSESANQRLSEIFRRHELTRCYEAWLDGHVHGDAWTSQTPVGGKPATTHFRVLERFTHAGYPVTRVEATLETGRTHQIRVHAASVGHPVLADLEHGKRQHWHPPRLALHAKLLKFEHPASGEPLEFTADLPMDLLGWSEAGSAPPATPAGAVGPESGVSSEPNPIAHGK